MEALQKDVRELIELFNAAGVRYLIVGAHAVGYHGHPRLTKDVDFFIEPSPENADRLVSALTRFGFRVNRATTADLARACTMLTFGVLPNRFDLITEISGVRFHRAWKCRITFIGREHLIRNKRATDRFQDLAARNGLWPASGRRAARRLTTMQWRSQRGGNASPIG